MKEPTGRPRRRRQDNIEIVVQGRGWKDVEWIDEALEIFKWWELVNAVMKRLVPYNEESLYTSSGIVEE